jgi:hypothetical protein
MLCLARHMLLFVEVLSQDSRRSITTVGLSTASRGLRIRACSLSLLLSKKRDCLHVTASNSTKADLAF